MARSDYEVIKLNFLVSHYYLLDLVYKLARHQGHELNKPNFC